MREIIHVGLGGLLGAVARFLAGRYLATLWMVPSHLATLAVNGLGSFVLGLVLGVALGIGRPVRGQLFLAVGFCGSFTTFSSWMSDIAHLAGRASLGAALNHVVLSMGLGLGAFVGGLYLGRQLGSR